jgi:hypothetical protein
MRDRGLLGRDRETAEITRLLDGVREGGGALVICGEAGIGKSALLTEARLVAADRAMAVVSAYGVRSETDLPFAGLHQIMRAWLTQLDGLPPVQRDAIRAAFGMSEATAPEPFMIAVAALAMVMPRRSNPAQRWSTTSQTRLWRLIRSVSRCSAPPHLWLGRTNGQLRSSAPPLSICVSRGAFGS